ncbi:MAG TPA: hypothetical protein VKU79_01855 [Thermoplasmataceae archaeon]|nr:hypothetical protein [Thermoplasmatales archaeon AK]HLH85593.1 hypothetical protein [Thermoplasmataceae archaeon]
MANLELSLGMADYDRTSALMSGIVRPAGVDLHYIVSPPSETFWRMLKFEVFDISEMSMSTFLISKSQGRRWKAIPVFPYRSFFHTAIFVREESGFHSPEELKGKKFGVPEYQVTAAVWLRGALEQDFDLKPSDMKWYMERRRELSHGGETSFKSPKGVSVEYLPDGVTLKSALLDGKIDALMPSPYPGMPSLLNRTDYLDLTRTEGIRLLFEDPVEEGKRYFRKHGYSHINHTVIVKPDLAEKFKWLPLNLYKAFEEAKEYAYQHFDKIIKSSLIFAYPYWVEQLKLFGTDPYPYGIKANRKALEDLIGMSESQGLIPSRLKIEDIFDETTLNL